MTMHSELFFNAHSVPIPADFLDVESGICTSPGLRPYQQDRYCTYRANNVAFAAVLDGHGLNATGHQVAQHCSRHLEPKLTSLRFWQLLAAQPDIEHPSLASCMRRVIAELEKESIDLNNRKKAYSGSTLCAVAVSPAGLLCANIGDSRAVLAVQRDASHLTALPLSVDHIPNHPAERARILAAGGWIKGGSLNNYISMSRAIGDNDLKAHRNITQFRDKPVGAVFSSNLFIADPEFACVRAHEDQRFLIVASDGVWDTVPNDVAVALVHRVLSSGRPAHKAAALLVKRALRAGSRDNSTAIVVVLNRQKVPEYAERGFLWRFRPRQALTIDSGSPVSSQDNTLDVSLDRNDSSASSSSSSASSSSDDVGLEGQFVIEGIDDIDEGARTPPIEALLDGMEEDVLTEGYGEIENPAQSRNPLDRFRQWRQRRVNKKFDEVTVHGGHLFPDTLGR